MKKTKFQKNCLKIALGFLAMAILTLILFLN